MTEPRGPVPSKQFVEAALTSAKEASGKAAELARQLALAGIAVVWLFREAAPDGSVLPEGLRISLMLLVLTLALDFLHYVVESLAWDLSNYIRLENFERGERDGLLSWLWRRQRLANNDYIIEYRPASFLYWAKVVTISVAYILLFRFLVQHMHFD